MYIFHLPLAITILMLFLVLVGWFWLLVMGKLCVRTLNARLDVAFHEKLPKVNAHVLLSVQNSYCFMEVGIVLIIFNYFIMFVHCAHCLSQLNSSFLNKNRERVTNQ